MSILLGMGTKPKNLYLKTHPNGFGDVGGKVVLGDYEISMADFAVVVEYVLTNTDLEPDDVRLQLVKCIKSMRRVKGWNNTPRSRHLQASMRPILQRHVPKEQESPKPADEPKSASSRSVQKKKSQGARRRK
ncbi:hypothetical protein HY629_02335 [Candidatus Uhrbacteria bacterium]|nr:hypothetical protein [Candidatus Uhrbacteria bacterium]